MSMEVTTASKAPIEAEAVQLLADLARGLLRVAEDAQAEASGAERVERHAGAVEGAVRFLHLAAFRAGNGFPLGVVRGVDLKIGQ